MNNYKAPRDKLICILNCCKVIFGKKGKKQQLENHKVTMLFRFNKAC